MFLQLSQVVRWQAGPDRRPPGPRAGSGAAELRITRVFPCVAHGFKACPSFMFAGCCWRRPLAIDGGSGTSRGHGPVMRGPGSSWGNTALLSPLLSDGTHFRIRGSRSAARRGLGSEVADRPATDMTKTTAPEGWRQERIGAGRMDRSGPQVDKLRQLSGFFGLRVFVAFGVRPCLSLLSEPVKELGEFLACVSTFRGTKSAYQLSLFFEEACYRAQQPRDDHSVDVEGYTKFPAPASGLWLARGCPEKDPSTVDDCRVQHLARQVPATRRCASWINLSCEDYMRA